jgi:two-component system OmpR family response regulator
MLQTRSSISYSANLQGPKALGSRVLVLSDDADAARVWSHALDRRGIAPAITEIDPSAERQIDFTAFDAIVIDHYQADTDIFTLCRQVRAKTLEPILLFTDAADERFHVKAYHMGVDECVKKPIGIPLMVAKILAWHNRATGHKQQTGELQVANFCIDLQHRLLTTPEEKTIRLSSLEARLLFMLMINRNQVLESQLLAERVWLGCTAGDIRLVKNLIYRLRRKIERDPEKPLYIQTVAGLGYMFCSPD